MKTQRIPRTLTALAAGILFLALTLPVAAQDEDPNDPNDADRECVMACRDANRDCRFDTREAFKLCLEESGCDVLATEYRETCLVVDRDEEACAAAREALRDCRQPCREAAREDDDLCREAFATCVTDECGLDELPGRGRHPHFRGPRGPHRGHR